MSVDQKELLFETFESSIEDDSVETEREDTDNPEIAKPFNPEKIRVRTVNPVVEQLASRIKHEEIDLSPDFQRMRGIWKPIQKSRLIESLLLKIPIPVFYVAADDCDNWSVVDGVQRISTIYDYMNNDFALEGMEYLSNLEGNKYDLLPRSMCRRIRETQLIVNVIEPGTPIEVMFNIFHRINTGGMRLNGQEIRHALNPGPVRDYLKNLAASEEFRRATADSIKKERMVDRECVLRFLAFHISPWECYGNKDSNNIDSCLIEAMKRLNKMNQEELGKVESIFKKSMKAAAEIFGTNAFRKPTNGASRNPINKALLEAWSVGLARQSVSELEKLAENREILQRRFLELLDQDHDFDKSISTSTGDPQRVKKRFNSIQHLIETCV